MRASEFLGAFPDYLRAGGPSQLGEFAHRFLHLDAAALLEFRPDQKDALYFPCLFHE